MTCCHAFRRIGARSRPEVLGYMDSASTGHEEDRAGGAGEGSAREIAIEPLKPLGPANAYGHMMAVHLLEDKEVSRFVYDGRKKRGIVPPDSRKQVGFNLADYHLDDLVAEARPVAREYWERFLGSEPYFVWMQRVFGVVRLLARRWGKVDFRGLDAWHILEMERLVETSAQVIGRFILADLLEVPQPINLGISAVRRIEWPGNPPMLVALIMPGGDLEDLIVELKRQFEEVTAESGTRLPAKAKETIWLRFCGRMLARRHKIGKRNKNQTLAKLALRIWPDRGLGDDEISEEYPERVRLLADTIRQNIKHFEDWKRGLFKNMPDVEPLSNSEN